MRLMRAVVCPALAALTLAARLTVYPSFATTPERWLDPAEMKAWLAFLEG